MLPIYLETLRDLDINFPELREQRLVVAKLDKINFQIKNMINSYKSKVDQLDLYKQSILNKAFSD
jgi:hypothetical protein